MRARNIKPGFFKNDELAELEPLARLLFAGLWCMADREGRFEWRPKKIKAEILPYDDCDIDALLMSLNVMTFIVMYRHGNDIYGHIPHFLDHQKPHPHEAKSSIPSPNDENSELIQCHDMSLTSREMSLTCPADILIPSSLIPSSLIPSSLIPSSPAPAEQASGAVNTAPAAQKNRKRKIAASAVPTSHTWAAYSEAYESRYGAPPVRNQKQNTLVKRFCERVGVEDAPGIIAHYLRSQMALYVRSGHALDLAVRDAEKLATEWKTGRHTTEERARQADKTGTNTAVLAEILKERGA